MDNKTTGPGFRAENRPVRRTRRGSPDRCANNAAAAPPSPPPQPPPPRFPRATGTAGWPGRASALKSRAGKTQAWGRRRQPALARTKARAQEGRRTRGGQRRPAPSSPSVRDAHASGSTEAQCAPLCTPGGAESAEARRGGELDEALCEHVALKDSDDGQDLVVDTIVKRSPGRANLQVSSFVACLACHKAVPRALLHCHINACLKAVEPAQPQTMSSEQQESFGECRTVAVGRKQAGASDS